NRLHDLWKGTTMPSGSSHRSHPACAGGPIGGSSSSTKSCGGGGWREGWDALASRRDEGPAIAAARGPRGAQQPERPLGQGGQHRRCSEDCLFWGVLLTCSAERTHSRNHGALF